MKTKRIDQYICIDTDKIIVDEMNDILDNGCGKWRFLRNMDTDAWERLQGAAKVILEFYEI